MARWIYPIEASMPAQRAVAIILETLLGAMAACERGVAERRGEEPLHDYRVAVRRTRSALSLFGGVLPAAALGRGRAVFKDLGRRTSEARDLDVLLLELPVYAKDLASAERAGLEELERRMARERALKYTEIRRWLEGETYDRRIASWRDDLEKLARAGDGDSMRRRAAEAIRNAAERATGSAQTARGDDPEGELLHRLRIRCKKLRYALEFASPLTPAGEVDRVLGLLKDLQDQLGTHQDLVVHERWLGTFSKASAEDSDPNLLGRRLAEVARQRRVRLRRAIETALAPIRENLAPEVDRVLAVIARE